MKYIKKEISFWGCIFFLIIFYLKNLAFLTIPSICFDEIGYWSAAAFWNGQNWSSVMGNLSPYYSYGYSVILFLLMKIFKNVEMLHQSAIVVNIFMMVVGYCIVNYLMKWLFAQINNNLRHIICMVPFFYPSIQFHTQTVWSETYLCLLFLISIVLMKKLHENGKMVFYFLFGVILVDLYITHQRCIAIVVIGILNLLVLSIFKKDRWGQFAVFMVTVIILMTGGAFVKESLYKNVYTDTTITEIINNNEADIIENNNNYNDFSGQVGKIQYLFSNEGIYSFLINYGGKIYYFILASFFVGGMGIWYMVQKIIKFVRNRSYDNKDLFVYCYILGSLFGTMAVAALFTIYPLRIDSVAYGRYTDFLVTIIIVFGIFKLSLFDRKENIKVFLVQILFCLIFLIAFEIYIEKYQVSGFYSSCSQIMSYFSRMDETNMLKLMTLITAIVGIILVLISFIKKMYFRFILIVTILLCSWIRISSPAIENLIHVQFTNVMYPIMECIESVPDINVYYFYDNSSCRTSNVYTGSIQYLMQDQTLYCIDDLELIDEKDSWIIICENLSVPEGYNVECETRFYKVLRRKNN